MTGVVRRYLDQGEPGVMPQEPPEEELPDNFEQDMQSANQAGVPPGMISGPAVQAQPQSDPYLQNAGLDYLQPPTPAPDAVSLRPPAQSQAPPDRLSILRDKLERKLTEAPVAKKPNWLERAGAIGAGAAAGWTNAAGRIKHPIDIQTMQQGILHPGYTSSMEQWKSEVAPLEAQVNIETQRQAAGFKGQQIANETALKAAQAKQAQDHGQYWLHRAQTEQLRYTVATAGPNKGQVFDRLEGTWKNGPPTPRDLYDEAMTIPGNTPERAQWYAMNNRSMAGYGSTLASPPTKSVPTATEDAAARAAGVDLAHPEKATPAQWAKMVDYLKPPKAPVDPLVEDRRRQLLEEGKNKDLDTLGKVKKDNDERVNAMRTQDINQTLQRMGYPGSAEAAMKLPAGDQFHDAVVGLNNKYAPMLQTNEQDFRDAAQRRGIDTTGHEYDIDKNTLEYKLRIPTAPLAPQSTPPGAAGAGRGAAPVQGQFRALSPDGTPGTFRTAAGRAAFLVAHPGSKAVN